MRNDMDPAMDVVNAEAAAWLARLQGPERTPAAEAAFGDWLRSDPAHAKAFSAATEVWDVLPGAARILADTKSAPARRTTMPWPRISAWTATIGLTVSTMLFVALDHGAPVYMTAVGERRTVPLEDGSHVTLNTASLLEVEYSAGVRLVRLKRGEAMFEVAKDAARPFVVDAGQKRITARGTTFVVRLDDKQKVSVTLVEGQVEVQSEPVARDRSLIAVLKPGERLTIPPADRAQRIVAVVDRPVIAAITAWRQGEVMFDDVPLAEAVAEFNRYGDLHVRLADDSLSTYRISGVFATRNPAEFADAIAKLHGLNVHHADRAILIGR